MTTLTAHAKTLKAIARAADALENGADGRAMAAYLRVVLIEAYDTDSVSWQQSLSEQDSHLAAGGPFPIAY